MSMTPRKKPEGLIDGCFGPSAYCLRCQYEKDFEHSQDPYCAACAPTALAENAARKASEDAAFAANYWKMVDLQIKNRTVTKGRKMKAETYRCMNKSCGTEFKANHGYVSCHGCGSDYVEWVNFYEDWKLDENNHWVRKDWSIVVDKNLPM